MEAIESRDPSVVDSLTDSDDSLFACRIGLELLEKLIRNGHQLQSMMIEDCLDGLEPLQGAWALVIAKFLGLSACADLLENIGAEVGAEDFAGNTILHVAARENNAEKARLPLLTEPKLVVRTEMGGNSALHICAHAGTLKVMEVLISFRANPKWRDPHGKTPLHVAVERNNFQCARLLIGHGAPLDAQNNDGETALFLAARAGFVECVLMLVEAGADVNLQTRNGQIPLHPAAARDHPQCLQQLLDAASDVNKADNQLWTPLHCAVDGNSVESLRLLLDKKVDVNAKMDEGRTALHICAARGREECVRVLLEHSPLPHLNEKDKQGRTPIQTATAYRHSKVIELLKEAEAKYKTETEN